MADSGNSGRLCIIPARSIDDRHLGRGALAVLCALGTYSDRDGRCWPSIEVLAKRLRVTRRRVVQCLRELETLGYIATQRRFDEGGQEKTRIYRILYDADPDSASGGDEAQLHGGMKPDFLPRDEAQLHTNVPIERPKERREKKSLRCTSLKELCVDDELSVWASEKTPAVDTARELEKFRDWHVANGKKRKDYRAAFRNWLRRAQEFHDARHSGKTASATKAPAVGTPEHDEMMRKLGVEP